MLKAVALIKDGGLFCGRIADARRARRGLACRSPTLVAVSGKQAPDERDERGAAP